MQLVIQGTGAAVTAVAELEPLLEHGTLAVRLDAVAGLLDAIRVAAQAVTPRDAAILETDPARMARVAQAIMTVANAARALAASAPAGDPNAQVVVSTLDQLHVYPLEPSVIETTIVGIDASANGSWPALRFPSPGRVLGAYLVSNTSALGTQTMSVALRNAGVDGGGTLTTAQPTAGEVVAGTVYPITISTGGPEIYEAGELLTVDVTTDVHATFSVQIDYQLDQ